MMSNEMPLHLWLWRNHKGTCCIAIFSVAAAAVGVATQLL